MSFKNKKIIIAFLVFLAIFSIMQFTVPNIIGYDGYFNIKSADIIKKQGLIKEFPYAKHTILSENYADIQFLFKIFLIPFTFFDLNLGAKIASIVFAALSFTVFYWFLIENRIRYAFYWTMLYLFSTATLMYRFMFTRPLPLVIAFLILTIYFIQKRKYLYLGITSFIFVWIHSGFVLQLFIILTYFIIERFFDKKFDFKLLLYSFSGTFLALIFNPYFPNNISFLYSQIFQINLLSNLYNVEWKPWTFVEFVKNNFLILLYIVATLFIFIKNKNINKTKAYFLSIALFFLVYTIKTRRMQEYLVPFSVLALAFFLNDHLKKIDKNKFLNYLKIGTITFLIIIAPINFYLLRQEIINNDILYNYDNCAEWMKNNIPKKSLVFNNAYAFPYLFFKNSDLIYTHGLDLTYSFLYNEKEFKRYMGILQGTLNTNIDWIKEDYKSDYIFSGKLKQDVQLFNFIVKNKNNYKAVYEDEWCAVLEVK